MNGEASSTRAQIDALADQIAVCAARIDAAVHGLLTHVRKFDALRGWAVQGSKSADSAEACFVRTSAVACPGVRNAWRVSHRACHTRSASSGKRRISIWTVPSDRVRRSAEARGATESEAELEAETETETETKAETEAHASLADAVVAIAEARLAGRTSIGQARGGAAAERRTLFVHQSERRLQPHWERGLQDDERAECDGRASAWKAELHGGTALSGDTLLRIACDSGLVVAKTDARGNVLDIGRRRRTVSAALMHALRLRDRRCRFPGCQHAAFVDAHHIEHWARGGTTSLGNLVLVCHGHHVALHEGGCRVERAPDGDLRFIDCDGRVIEAAPSPPPLAMDGERALRLEQHERGVHIDWRTSMIRRPFPRPDLTGCVRALARQQARGRPLDG